MRKLTYLAVLEPSSDGYGVYFPDLVKNEMDNRRVKTNVTIPSWLKEEAESKKVNYSKLLEASLKDFLNLAQ